MGEGECTPHQLIHTYTHTHTHTHTRTHTHTLNVWRMERTPWKWNKRKSSSNPCPKPPALISRKFLKRQKLNQQLEKWHAPINWQKWLLILPKLSLEYWSLHNLRLMFSQCKSYDPHTFTVVCVSFNCDVQYRNVMNHFPCYQADSIHGCSYNWLCLFFFVCLLCVVQKNERQAQDEITG